MDNNYNVVRDAKRKEANAAVSKLLAEADAKLQEAADLARREKIDFSWEGPAYGMGGYFHHDKLVDRYGDETDGWQASSQSC